MAKRTAEELSASLSALLEDDTTDEALQFLTDLRDSVNGDGVDWEQKYNENDKTWRERYRDAFIHGTGKDEEPEDEEPNYKTFESLFKEV